MLLLGHTGITLGSAVILDTLFNRKRFHEETLSSTTSITNRLEARLISIAQHIDIRVLLIGALLPDIIDKPLGYIIFRDTLSNGRIICHTALFLFIILIAGTYLYIKFKRSFLLVLSFGTFTHLIFDQMWLNPHTLLWPLYGWNFPHGESNITLFFKNVLIGLISTPSTYIPEIIGAIVLLIFTWQLIRLKSLSSFIIKGSINKLTPGNKIINWFNYTWQDSILSSKVTSFRVINLLSLR